MSGPPLWLRIPGFIGALLGAAAGTDIGVRLIMAMAAGYLLCSILGTLTSDDRRPNP